ncbi:V-type proton ATPase subunit E isoform X1 [Cimex lectularius]|uniref:V-type proton ATPase subunit E n=2 Tax=Cimex lectularius TaxID=79782 RepID=A0A8I6RWR8_CIMLE|nr:V-type proton ATPase subunit E isoform X1 [Cimex lectularius]
MIKHMMAFIEQEATEKAEEIEQKAEEEFNIEKGRLVQNRRLKVMEYYDRKEKQVELQKKIQSSNMLNQARLKALKVREDHVRNVLDEARKRLIKSVSNTGDYQVLLQKLILQGLFQLLENEVTLKVREVDQDIVKQVLPNVVEEYEKKTGVTIKLKVDSDTFLPAESSGGVELNVCNGRIKISNTLESRLDLISQLLVPQIRNALFGKNPNRKFDD